MNILYLIEFFFIEISFCYLVYTNKLVYYISPKFFFLFKLMLIIVGVLIVINLIFLFSKKIKFFKKRDFSIILFSIPIIIFIIKPKLNINEMINKKHKDNIKNHYMQDFKKNLGLKLNRKKLKKTNLQNNEKTILQVYNELYNFKTEKEILNYNYKINIIGQIYEPSIEDNYNNNINLYENEFMIVRMLMVCCIADMVPLAIVIRNDSNFDYKTNEEKWVRIKGKMTFIKNKKGDFVGYIYDDKIDKIKEPLKPWLYPDLKMLMKQSGIKNAK